MCALLSHRNVSGLQASEAYLQTNNQVLSLTDQMNLGVRIVELDTHFFDVRLCTAASYMLHWHAHICTLNC